MPIYILEWEALKLYLCCMEYDPAKDIIAIPMRMSPLFRRTAFKLFELGFLRVRHVKRTIRKIFHQWRDKKDIQVLDIGFGFGPYTDFMLRDFENVKVTGIEVKDEQVRDCQDFFRSENLHSRCKFRVEDALELQYKDRFDFAIAIDLLEHIEDDVKVMSNACNALLEGGKLLIHTPASLMDSRLSEQKEFFVGEHVRDGYGAGELEEKLRQAGFSDVQIIFTYGKWGILSWWLMQGIPFTALHKFPPVAVLLPIYYALIFPFAHRFMIADLAIEDKKSGNGVMAIATK